MRRILLFMLILLLLGCGVEMAATQGAAAEQKKQEVEQAQKQIDDVQQRMDETMKQVEERHQEIESIEDDAP